MKYNTLRGIRNYVAPVLAAGLTACAGPRSMTPSPSMSEYNRLRLDGLAAEICGGERRAIRNDELEVLNELLRINGIEGTVIPGSEVTVPGRIDPNYGRFIEARINLMKEADANRDGRVENGEVERLLERYRGDN
ncbi:hypothetical protein HY500_04465 [Candidatus Woesearchaeota archaeon]|nr:hypothetical protein [Candidatus Woesearchaeota archaeon]